MDKIDNFKDVTLPEIYNIGFPEVKDIILYTEEEVRDLFHRFITDLAKPNGEILISYEFKNKKKHYIIFDELWFEENKKK